ncbi:MAG: hypothetical protein ACI87E_000025 [Mariniblastus sp.]
MTNANWLVQSSTGCLTTFSKDGKLYAVATSREFHFYSTGDWKLLNVIPPEKTGLGYASFSDDNFAAADKDFVALHSIKDFSLIAKLQITEACNFPAPVQM